MKKTRKPNGAWNDQKAPPPWRRLFARLVNAIRWNRQSKRQQIAREEAERLYINAASEKERREVWLKHRDAFFQN